MKETKNAVLITGAAGDLGKAIVKMAFSLPDVDKIIATDIKESVKKIYSGDERVLPFVMNAASENSLKKVRDELEELNVRVKYIVNNAGIFFFHPVSELNEELLDKVMKVNIYAPVLTVSVFLKHLKETRGRVVQISSCAVKYPTFFQAYPASKMSMEAFSVSLRQELNIFGVKLVIIRSGAIKTALIDEMKKLPVPVDKSLYKEEYSRFLNQVDKNLGNVISPEKAAEAVKKAILAEKPKYIYTINRNKTISIMSLFPQKIKDMLTKLSIKPE
ncbi:MAG: SDR family NAD(P)-dependent oxidoreductase [Chlorobi bacterium]|nr:SDR family NAD(P)-dependent oxidoreductase [Chlorobiota bacterium]